MTALTEGRLTPRRGGDYISGLVAASTTLFAGALVMRNATGYLVEGQTATGLVGVGVADAEADNSGGADGDISARVRPGIFRFANSAGADEITIAEIGDVVFAVDDQTVAKTDGTATRSPAGIVEDVDAQGVWVRFDAALTAAAAA
ncbi:hypothetical protein [Mameliella alba]|uniref:hypothetical protein n=1 Tax=Mameliella alba TaxID=561184 RepID=UPI000B533B5C|nr:hypothetical protein [Mameliella alba]OWV43190.1 hypothetical protein CDZ95_10375 [Mameliella alba]